VRRTIARERLLAGGETVLVGVSGGADSTALLHVLAALAPELGLALHVLHVDHGLRRDSARDAEVVRRLAARYGLPVDVATVTVERTGSLEEAARRARHAALEAGADRVGASRIALGHTADDQAETVLMRLLEGTGLRGLAGIRPRRGRVIRPLLEVRRQAIADLLAAAGLSWIEDPTNRDCRFLRNRVRHQVLPALARQADRGDLVRPLTRVARQARAAVETVEALGRRELDRLGDRQPGALVLSRSALAALPPPVAAEVLRQGAQDLGGRASWRAWEHRGLARALALPPPRRGFRLGGMLAEVSGDRLRLAREPRSPLRARALGAVESLLAGGAGGGAVVALDEIGLRLEARVLPARGYAVPRGAARVAFDADGLGPPLLVRPRRGGDRMIPFGAVGPRRLKTLLIDARIPRWDRACVPLVEAQGQIVWVGGLRRGAAAPVTAATRRILELALHPLAQGAAGT
jgi:tRNA(Ile)-lysidine synthase